MILKKYHMFWLTYECFSILCHAFLLKSTISSHNSCAHCVILLYCETLLQFLLGIYCKRFYWIPLFTILLLFYVFEVGKAKSATQSVLMILTLNGLFQKNFQVFYFTPENSLSLNLPPSPCLFFFPL